MGLKKDNEQRAINIKENLRRWGPSTCIQLGSRLGHSAQNLQTYLIRHPDDFVRVGQDGRTVIWDLKT